MYQVGPSWVSNFPFQSCKKFPAYGLTQICETKWVFLLLDHLLRGQKIVMNLKPQRDSSSSALCACASNLHHSVP